VPYLEEGQYFSAYVNPDGTFSVSIPVYQPVLYDLKYRGMKMEALLCPDEPVFKVRIVAGYQEVKSMKCLNSHQYDAYRDFKRITADINNKVHTLLACRDEKGCMIAAKKEFSGFNDKLALLQKTFKGTFTADALVPVSMLPGLNTSAPLRKQLSEHYFDAVPWSDARIYNLPEPDNKISFYIDEIGDTAAESRMAFIEYLWKQAKGDKDIGKDILALMIHNFAGNNREPYLQSLVQWANKQPRLAEDQPVMASKIMLIEKTIPGATAAEVSGEDTAGKQHVLSAMVKNSKLTLLIFWSSECSHCRKSLPEFGRLYRKYHSKGLEIFAASVDGSKNTWKDFVERHKLPWLNVILNEETTGAHEDYYIQYTPTLVLIDNHSKIIHRFMETPDLDKMIGDYLK
jgi:thiol-disulfide isomerase/thioredoxin